MQSSGEKEDRSVMTQSPLTGVDYSARVATAWQGAVFAANRFRHGYVGTEHLLLGLAVATDGTAHYVLQTLGVQYAQIYNHVESQLGVGSAPGRDPLPAPRVREVVALAWKHTERRGDTHLRTADLLLGLEEEGNNRAIKTLQELGVSRRALRLQAHAILFSERAVNPLASGPTRSRATPTRRSKRSKGPNLPTTELSRAPSSTDSNLTPRQLTLHNADPRFSVLACPLCPPGRNPEPYIHTRQAEIGTGADEYTWQLSRPPTLQLRSRETEFQLKCACEQCGGEFYLYMGFHKGKTMVWTES